MIGNNQIIFNQATVCEIFQAWARKAFSDETLKVNKVESKSSYSSNEFTIEIQGEMPKTEEANGEEKS